MERYSKIVDEFCVVNCNVKEEEILKKINATHKKSWRHFATIAACITLILVATTVTTAATGLIDLSSIFKRIFTDDVTDKLIDQGAVQELNLSSQSENYILTFEGITGDSDTQFGVFKLVDTLGLLGDPSLLQLDVTMVGVSVVESGKLSEYGTCLSDSFSTLEGEENTFYIKVCVPTYWTSKADEDMYISLIGVTAYYGDIEYNQIDLITVEKADKIVEIPFGFEFTFTPDKSVFQQSSTLTIGKTLVSDVSEFTLDSLDLSNYNARLVITFPTNENIVDIMDATALWHNIDKDYIFEDCGIPSNEEERNEIVIQTLPEGSQDYACVSSGVGGGHRIYKTVKNPSEYLEGDIKLFVDDVEIARINIQSSSASNMEYTDSITWGMPLMFEPFDLLSARSIEIRYLDQTVVVK